MNNLKTIFKLLLFTSVFGKSLAQLISITGAQVSPSFITTGALPINRERQLWQFMSGNPTGVYQENQCQHMNFGPLLFTPNTTGFTLTTTFAFIRTSQANEVIFEAEMEPSQGGYSIILQRRDSTAFLSLMLINTAARVNQTFTTTASFAQNTIYNLAVVYGASQLSFYVNGASVNNFTVGTAFWLDQMSVNTYVGRSDATLSRPCLSGSIFALRIWNRQLGASELASNLMVLNTLSLNPTVGDSSPFIAVVPGAVQPLYSTGAVYPLFGKRLFRFDSPDNAVYQSSTCRYLDFSSRTIQLSTKGFTLAASFRFSGQARWYERIIDWSNSGAPFIVMGRYDSLSYMQFHVADVVSNVGSRATTQTFGPLSVSQNTVYNLVFTYRTTSGSTGTLDIWNNGNLLASVTSFGFYGDRTLALTYVGSPSFATVNDGCFGGDLFSLQAFQRVLNQTEIRQLNIDPLEKPFLSLVRSVISSPYISGNPPTISERGLQFSRGANGCQFMNFGSELLGMNAAGFTVTAVLEFSAANATETVFEISDQSNGNGIRLTRLQPLIMIFSITSNFQTDSLPVSLLEEPWNIYRFSFYYNPQTSMISLWFRNVVAASKSTSLAIRNSFYSTMMIGRSAINQTCYNGFVHALKFYDRVLTTQEIVRDLSQNITICMAGFFYNSNVDLCFPCPSDSYKPVAGNSNCTQIPNNSISTQTSFLCNPGFYLGTDECLPCPVNQYKPNLGNNLNCTMCPTNFTCSGSTISCSPGFTLVGNFKCENCPANSFKNTAGNSSCTPIPANSVSTGSSFLCNPGYYFDAIQCQPCPFNHFKKQFSNDASCSSCPSNATCSPTNFTCDAGFTLSIDATKCQSCPIGTFKSTQGNTNCTEIPQNSISTQVDFLCNPGYFFSNGQCVGCPINQFKSGFANDLTCSPCPSDSICLSTNFTCNAGFTLSADTGSCLSCPPGTFKATQSNENCSEIPANSVSTQTYFLCKPGYYFRNNHCSPCPLNQFKSSTANDLSCSMCPSNAECSSTNFSCNAGFSLSADGKSCQACPSGSFKSQQGNTICSAVPANSVSTQTYFACNPGYFFSNGQCLGCPINQFKSGFSNELTCSPCPTDSTCSSINFTCNAGFTLSSNQNNCETCSINSYKLRSGNEACLPCPARATCMNSTSVICDEGYVEKHDPNGLITCDSQSGKQGNSWWQGLWSTNPVAVIGIASAWLALLLLIGCIAGFKLGGASKNLQQTEVMQMGSNKTFSPSRRHEYSSFTVSRRQTVSQRGRRPSRPVPSSQL